MIERVRWNLFTQPILPLRKRLELAAQMPFQRLPAQALAFCETLATVHEVPIEMVVFLLIGAMFIAARGSFKIKISSHYYEVLTAYMILSVDSGQFLF